MRIVCFEAAGSVSFGVLDGDRVTAIDSPDREPNAIFADLGTAARSSGGTSYPLSEVTLLPPVPRPGKVICLGLNYVDHAKEGGNPIPDYPAVFLRCATSLVGLEQPIIRPSCSDRLDYEGELAIIIGRTAFKVSAD